MTKAKKSAKEASNILHNIMQASTKGNPKPVNKATKIKRNTEVVKHREGGDLSTK